MVLPKPQIFFNEYQEKFGVDIYEDGEPFSSQITIHRDRTTDDAYVDLQIKQTDYPRSAYSNEFDRLGGTKRTYHFPRGTDTCSIHLGKIFDKDINNLKTLKVELSDPDGTLDIASKDLTVRVHPGTGQDKPPTSKVLQEDSIQASLSSVLQNRKILNKEETTMPPTTTRKKEREEFTVDEASYHNQQNNRIGNLEGRVGNIEGGVSQINQNLKQISQALAGKGYIGETTSMPPAMTYTVTFPPGATTPSVTLTQVPVTQTVTLPTTTATLVPTNTSMTLPPPPTGSVTVPSGFTLVPIVPPTVTVPPGYTLIPTSPTVTLPTASVPMMPACPSVPSMTQVPTQYMSQTMVPMQTMTMVPTVVPSATMVPMPHQVPVNTVTMSQTMVPVTPVPTNTFTQTVTYICPGMSATTPTMPPPPTTSQPQMIHTCTLAYINGSPTAIQTWTMPGSHSHTMPTMPTSPSGSVTVPTTSGSIPGGSLTATPIPTYTNGSWTITTPPGTLTFTALPTVIGGLPTVTVTQTIVPNPPMPTNPTVPTSPTGSVTVPTTTGTLPSGSFTQTMTQTLTNVPIPPSPTSPTLPTTPPQSGWQLIQPRNGWQNTSVVDPQSGFVPLQFRCTPDTVVLLGSLTGLNSTTPNTLLVNSNQSSVMFTIPASCGVNIPNQTIPIRGYSTSGQRTSVDMVVVRQPDGSANVYIYEEGLDPTGAFSFDSIQIQRNGIGAITPTSPAPMFAPVVM